MDRNLFQDSGQQNVSFDFYTDPFKLRPEALEAIIEVYSKLAHTQQAIDT